MAILFNNQTQQRCILQSHHSFGRRYGSVNTFVADAFISKIHAYIEWDEQNWLLRDVSINGTWLNGHKLACNQVAPLKVGDVISLASKLSYAFEVVDIKPPCDCLMPIEHDSEIIELEHFHLLPSIQSRKMVLSYNNQTYSWWQEILDDSFSPSSNAYELNDKEYLTIDGLTWQLQINRSIADTQELKSNLTLLDELTFIFNTSLDEESTQIFMQHGEQNINFMVRSHHYLTLMLARQRAKDMQAGLNNTEQGWLYAEGLAKDLGLDANHLNIQIYRIRKQFVEALNNNCDSSHIIERNSGKLRLASKCFRIIRGDAVEFDTSQFMGHSIEQQLNQDLSQQSKNDHLFDSNSSLINS